jgi:hypothetical protein
MVSLRRSMTTAILVLFAVGACTSTPSTHNGDQNLGTGAVGTALPSGQDCAARIRRDQPQGDRTEPRPENTQANHVMPDRVLMPVWKDFTKQANQELVPRIDGKSAVIWTANPGWTGPTADGAMPAGPGRPRADLDTRVRPSPQAQLPG